MREALLGLRRLSLSALGLAAFSVALVGIALAASFVNGGFESGDLSYWESGGNVQVTGLAARLGNYGLRAYGSGGATARQRLIWSGDGVNVEAWVNQLSQCSGGAPACSYVYIIDDDGGPSYGTATYPEGVTGWQKLSISYPYSQTVAVMWFYLARPNGGVETYFDDAQNAGFTPMVFTRVVDGLTVQLALMFAAIFVGLWPALAGLVGLICVLWFGLGLFSTDSGEAYALAGVFEDEEEEDEEE